MDSLVIVGAVNHGNPANRSTEGTAPEPVAVVVEEEPIECTTDLVCEGSLDLLVMVLHAHPGKDLRLLRQRIAVELISSTDERVERRLLVGAKYVAPERRGTVERLGVDSR